LSPNWESGKDSNRLAANGGEAKRVEAVLTRIGIDYAVEIAPSATR
jgi:hypothetical protein